MKLKQPVVKMAIDPKGIYVVLVKAKEDTCLDGVIHIYCNGLIDVIKIM